MFVCVYVQKVTQIMVHKGLPLIPVPFWVRGVEVPPDQFTVLCELFSSFISSANNAYVHKRARNLPAIEIV